MLIQFNENAKYSENGFTCKQGHKGEVREVADTAACRLIRDKAAFQLKDLERRIEMRIWCTNDFTREQAKTAAWIAVTEMMKGEI